MVKEKELQSYFDRTYGIEFEELKKEINELHKLTEIFIYYFFKKQITTDTLETIKFNLYTHPSRIFYKFLNIEYVGISRALVLKKNNYPLLELEFFPSFITIDLPISSSGKSYKNPFSNRDYYLRVAYTFTDSLADLSIIALEGEDEYKDLFNFINEIIKKRDLKIFNFMKKLLKNFN